MATGNYAARLGALLRSQTPDLVSAAISRVSAVTVSPPRVTVDGRTMPYIDNGWAPSVGDPCVVVVDGQLAIAWGAAVVGAGQCPNIPTLRLGYALGRTTIQGGNPSKPQLAPPGVDAAYFWENGRMINVAQDWLFDHPNFVCANFKTTEWTLSPPSGPDPSSPPSGGYWVEEGTRIPGDNIDRHRADGIRTASGDWYAALGFNFDEYDYGAGAWQRCPPQWIWKNGAYLMDVPEGGDRYTDGPASFLFHYDWQLDRVYFCPRQPIGQTRNIYLLDGAGGSSLWHASDLNITGHGSGGYGIHIEAPGNNVWIWNAALLTDVVTGAGYAGVLHLDQNGNELGRWHVSTINTKLAPLHVTPDGDLVVRDYGATPGQQYLRIDASTHTATPTPCQDIFRNLGTFELIYDMVPTDNLWSGTYLASSWQNQGVNIGDATATYGGLFTQWHSASCRFWEIDGAAIL